jgi:hypothetical protein
MENGFDRTTPRVYCLGVMEVELTHPKIGLPLIERAIAATPSGRICMLAPRSRTRLSRQLATRRKAAAGGRACAGLRHPVTIAQQFAVSKYEFVVRA